VKKINRDDFCVCLEREYIPLVGFSADRVFEATYPSQKRVGRKRTGHCSYYYLYDVFHWPSDTKITGAIAFYDKKLSRHVVAPHHETESDVDELKETLIDIFISGEEEPLNKGYFEKFTNWLKEANNEILD